MTPGKSLTTGTLSSPTKDTTSPGKESLLISSWGSKHPVAVDIRYSLPHCRDMEQPRWFGAELNDFPMLEDTEFFGQVGMNTRCEWRRSSYSVKQGGKARWWIEKATN